MECVVSEMVVLLKRKIFEVDISAGRYLFGLCGFV